jgi:hypothetical protein
MAPLFAATQVHAQNAPPAPPKEKSAFSKASRIFSGPLHPVVKGVAPGGGFGVGVGYDVPSDGRWETQAEAVLTLRRFWSAGFDTAYLGDHSRFQAYTRTREMPQLAFFGSGIQSQLGNRTSFLMRDSVIGAVGSLDVTPWMTVGGRLEEIWFDIAAGRATRYPSIEAMFGEGEAPGLTEQPRVGRYQGFVELSAPAGGGQDLNQGGTYRVSYGVFDDQRLERFSFTRLDLEARHMFTVFGPHRRLTLRGWVATTDAAAGHDVPFYLQPTLGGSGQIRSVNEDAIGIDGSRGTLRGYDNYRFRDRNLLLLQAEYRVPVWGPVDASVFVDAGKVASRRDDLTLSGLKRNYGFAISMMKGASTVVRIDFGAGGGEGTKVKFSFNDLLP